jgi:hypothetical protein
MYGVAHLNADEVAFFKTHGYLVKKDVLDPELVAKARSAWWACCPSPYVREDDPQSWLGGFANKPDFQALASASKAEQDKNAILNNGIRWSCREVGGTELFLDLLPRACWGAAEQLCGKNTLIWPDGKTKPGRNYAHPGANMDGDGSPGRACRGVYANFPPAEMSAQEREAAARADARATKKGKGAHADGWDGDRWRLGVITTLDDIHPGGGAFTVWPGSHRRLGTFTHGISEGKQYGGTGTGANVQAEIEKIKVDTEPVECWGPRGSVIFWHSRMLHAAMRNTSTTIRSSVLYEYYKKEDPAIDNSPRAELARGSPVDMWSDWSDEVRASPLLSTPKL